MRPRRPAPALPHVRAVVVRQLELTCHVQVEDLPHPFEFAGDEVVRVGVRAGVVHEQPHLTAVRRRADARDRIGREQVEGEGLDFDAVLPHRLRGGLQRSRLSRDQQRYLLDRGEDVDVRHVHDDEAALPTVFEQRDERGGGCPIGVDDQ